MTRLRRAASASCAACVALALASACDPDAAAHVDGGVDVGVDDVDGGTKADGGGGGIDVDAGPAVVQLDGDAEVDREAITTTTIALSLGDDRVAVATTEGFAVLDGRGDPIVQGVGVPRVARALSSSWASSLGEGAALLATDAGLFAIGRDGQGALAVLESPLSDRVGVVTDVVELDDTLWIASERGLFRYDATHFEEVRPGGLPLAHGQLAAPMLVDGHGLVAVASDRGLFAVGLVPATAPASGLQLVAYDLGVFQLDALDVDVHGTLWLAAQQRLLSRAADGAWTEWIFVDDVTHVAAGRAADDVWIVVGGTLVHGTGGAMRAAGAAPAVIAAADDGAAIIVQQLDGAQHAMRLREGRSVRIDAPREAEVLLAPRSLEIRALPRTVTTTIEVTLDGVALAFDATTGATIDPAALSPGLHTLIASAHYADGDDRSATRQFFAQSAELPTWTGDIRPLFETLCVSCHTATGGAHPLDGSDLWRAEIDRIVAALDAGEMPLGRTMSDDERRRVRLWAATGMQE